MKMISNGFGFILRSLVVVVVFWTVGLLLVQTAYRMGGVDAWAWAQAGQVVATALGIVIALRLQVWPMAYLLAGFTAFGASELAVHLVYGNRVVQGAQTHWAVLGAGVVGAVLSASLPHLQKRST